MSVFRLAESFVSINGEGRYAGKLALFLRFTGCNLRCDWCDTMWANSNDAPHTLCDTDKLAEIAEQAIADYDLSHVTLTGGEPLLQKDLFELCDVLSGLGLAVEIETNGSVPIKPLIDSCCRRPSFTMDYKLPSSGMESKMHRDNLPLLDKQDTLKFVCASEEDLECAAQIIEKYKPSCEVFFSPVFGRIEPVRIVEFMKKKKLGSVRIQLQLHKFIWSPDEKGV